MMKQTFTLLLLLVSPILLFAQPGTLDSSFGNNGVVTTEIAVPYSFGNATVVQSDGKIIVAGEAGIPSSYQAAVARYNADGSLDTSFGIDGKLIIPIGTAKSFAQDVALQEDGKIVLGARTWDDISGDIALVRLNADGTFDSSFGTDGIVIASSGGNDIATSVLISQDGKIYLAGDTDDNFSVTRFNIDGTLDMSFGTNGWASIPFDGWSYVQDIALQDDGKMVLGGFIVNTVGRYQMAAARINTDGTLDNSFGTGGKVVFSFGVDHDIATALAIQDDGKIVLGGHTYIRSNPRLAYDFAVVRLNTDGDFDSSFGVNGVATARIVEEANYANDIVIQEDGKVILGGRTVEESEYDLAMLRFNADGTLDDTFGNGGKVSTDINGREDQGQAIALQEDNKIILAGYSYTAAGNGAEFVVARYHNDDTVGVEDNQKNVFSIYPNPAREQLTIKMTDASSTYQLEIVDMLGKKVYDSEIQNMGQVDVSALAAGTYLLKLNSSSQTSTLRFIKK